MLSEQDNGFLFECSTNCLSGYSSFERRRFYLRIGQRENAKTSTTKSPCAVYWDNDLATATVTAVKDLTGRRNLKQEVVWNLERTLNCWPAVIQHKSHRHCQCFPLQRISLQRPQTVATTHFSHTKQDKGRLGRLLKLCVIIYNPHQMVFQVIFQAIASLYLSGFALKTELPDKT